MDYQKKLIELLNRCPIWAITPDGISHLVFGVGVYTDTDIEAYKPQVNGKDTNKTMVIPIEGVLTKDEPWAGTTYGLISGAAEQAMSDPSIKRVVLSVDSPGGSCTGLQECGALIAQLAKVKPVHAIVEGTSASAAYWLTSQASDITVSPSAEVGSVGVRMMHVDLSKALDNDGIKVTEMHAGKFKTEWSPFTPLTDEAKADMQARLDNMHGDFIKAVTQGRGARATAAITEGKYGEGRMFSASDALGHGMVDKVQPTREFYKALRPAEETNTDKPVIGLPLRRARLELEKLKF